MPATALIQTLDRDKVTQANTEASVLLTWATGIYLFRQQSGNDFWLLKSATLSRQVVPRQTPGSQAAD